MPRGPKKLSLKDYISRLIHRHGQAFAEDISKLHEWPRTITTYQMSDKYKLSRERIRQIHYRIYGSPIVRSSREAE